MIIKLITLCYIICSTCGIASCTAQQYSFGNDVAITNMCHESAKALLNETRIITAMKMNNKKISVKKMYKLLNNINIRIAKALNMFKTKNYNIEDIEKITEEIRQISEFATALAKISLNKKTTLQEIFQKTLGNTNTKAADNDLQQIATTSKDKSLQQPLKVLCSIIEEILRMENKIERGSLLEILKILKKALKEDVGRRMEETTKPGLTEVFKELVRFKEAQNEARE